MVENPSTFGESLAKSFAGGVLGDMAARAVMKRRHAPFDFVDSTLSGMMTGTALVSYPLATKILYDNWEKFRAEADDPDGNKFLVYVTSGATAVAITTAVDVPLYYIREARFNRKLENAFENIFDPKKFFDDSIPRKNCREKLCKHFQRPKEEPKRFCDNIECHVLDGQGIPTDIFDNFFLPRGLLPFSHFDSVAGSLL